MSRILITAGQELAGLGVLRSLGRTGHTVTAGHVEGVHPAAQHSRYCSATVAYPDPWVHHQAFQDWLLAAARSGAYDVIIPITEAEIAAADRMRGSVPASVRLILPSPQHLAVTLSKYRSCRAAMDAGLPVAKTVFVHDGAGAWQTDLTSLSFPIVLKTDNVLTQQGVYRKGKCFVARTAQEAQDILAQCRQLGCAVIAQEFVAGHGVGTSLLRWKGEIPLAFTHRRLHEVPWTGGASSLRVSMHDSAVETYAKTFVHTLGYEGVAMIEFRRSPDGTPYFMEINGRFWGSIALSLHAGIDIPAALLDCIEKGSVDASRARTYSDGILCRNLYPGELKYVLSVLRAKPQAGLPSAPGVLRTVLAFLFLTLDPRVRSDIFWWSDPLPALWQLLVAAADLRGGIRHQWTKFFSSGKKKRALHGRSETKPLPRDATNILFLCLGNICRSPFAELFWNEQLRPQHSLLPHATSAGFYPVADRRTPEKFLPLTTKFGVDLSNHRSRIVNQAMVDEAEIICIMDGDNWLDFIKTYPSAKDKLYFLGAFDDPQAPEIPDPDRLDAHEARPIYERIARSLHALASRLC